MHAYSIVLGIASDDCSPTDYATWKSIGQWECCNVYDYDENDVRCGETDDYLELTDLLTFLHPLKMTREDVILMMIMKVTCNSMQVIMNVALPLVLLYWIELIKQDTGRQGLFR